MFVTTFHTTLLRFGVGAALVNERARSCGDEAVGNAGAVRYAVRQRAVG